MDEYWSEYNNIPESLLYSFQIKKPGMRILNELAEDTRKRTYGPNHLRRPEWTDYCQNGAVAQYMSANRHLIWRENISIDRRNADVITDFRYDLWDCPSSVWGHSNEQLPTTISGTTCWWHVRYHRKWEVDVIPISLEQHLEEKKAQELPFLDVMSISNWKYHANQAPNCRSWSLK